MPAPPTDRIGRFVDRWGAVLAIGGHVAIWGYLIWQGIAWYRATRGF